MTEIRRRGEMVESLGWDFPIVDLHTHGHYTKSIKGQVGYGWTIPFDGSTEEQIQHMDWAGVAKAVIHPASFMPSGCGPWEGGGYMFTKPISLEEARKTNDQVAACVEKYPDRLIGFARIPPSGTREDVDEIDRAVRELGLSGIGHSGIGRGDGKNPYPILEKAAELKIPVEGISFEELDVLAPSFPGVSFCKGCFLLTALHRPEAVRRFRHILERHENVFADAAVTLAYQPTEALKLMREIGFDRFAFGTDFPVLGYTIDHYITILERHSRHIEEIPKEEMAKFFWGNAAKILNLPSSR